MKWIPMLLAGVGSIAVTFGLFIAVFTVTRAPARHEGIRMPDMIYVGANTCYTCHKDQEHNWSQMITMQEVAHPLANPQSMTLEVNLKTETAPLLIGTSGASGNGPQTDWRESPHYVIATEEGSIASPSRKPASRDCIDCNNTTPETSDNSHSDALAVICTICHLRNTTPIVERFQNVRA